MKKPNTPVTVAAEKILQQVGLAVSGKDDVLFWVLATVLVKGHILLEDIPGVGKTTMALAFSKVLGLQHNRMQFTPDVLPSDVTGFSVPDPTTGQLTYRPGAVCCNLFLADELNRATSRTQSALLEAMEEQQVTVDGISHRLPDPFLVLATQNPTGAAGTQMLPDSQVDRFTVRLSLGYPSLEAEVQMVKNRRQVNPLHSLETVVTPQELAALQAAVAETFVSDAIIDYVVRIIHATRSSSLLERGGSPRATLVVLSLARAVAQLQGRDYVVPQDVQSALFPSLCHRLQLSPEAQAMTASQVLGQLLQTVPAPKVG